MSFLDRIAECNAHDLGNFLPFRVGTERVGWLRKSFVPELDRHADVFTATGAGVSLADGLHDYRTRTDAVDAVLRALAGRGLIGGWRDEPYPVGGPFGGPHAFEMERAAVPLFGVRAYGVHVNGYVRESSGLRMWVARRARDKPTYPGMLDNMIAGGQPVGLGPMENVIKEAGEEAGVPPGLAARATPAGAVTYCQETAEGLKPDVMFVYDLELPPDFEPRNTDGEIESFELWPVERVMAVVAETADFKFNCNLAIIDFCVRHGLIAPEHPDYIEIVEGLRRRGPPG